MATRPSEPLWIGRRRGTNLSSLVAFPEPEPEPQGPFLGRLWDRLFNTVDGATAAVIGFLTTMNAFTAAEEGGLTANLEQELVALFEAQNETNDPATSIPATILRVTVSLKLTETATQV